jgi:hypothetical protein
MRRVTDAHDESRLSRLLRTADSWNQIDIDAATGRVELSGPGVVFFTSGWALHTWAPQVRIDGGERQRLPVGTRFVQMTPGWHLLRFEKHLPRPWHHAGAELAVLVPTDGQVTLFVTAVGYGYGLPTVVPASGSEGAVWLKGPEPPRGSADTQ